MTPKHHESDWEAHDSFSDLSCVWLQMRRWRASCDMWRDCRPPCRLMYETSHSVVGMDQHVLALQEQQEPPKARSTANNSRQLMCQSSRGPAKDPVVTCPLHVASWMHLSWQHAGTLVLRAPQPIERLGPTRGWMCCSTSAWLSCDVCHGAMPISGLVVWPVLKWSHMEQFERHDSGRGCHMP